MKKKLIIICCTLFAAMLMTGCCLKHDWEDATCKEPQTCSKCGKTQGDKLDHEWIAATCEAPKTCELCGKTKGDALEHEWLAATCEEPMTCANCGATQGEAYGHSWSYATCQEERYCYICNESDGVKGEHDWMDATCENPEYCWYCGETRGEPDGHTWYGTDYVYCYECWMDLPDNSFNRGQVLWRGVSMTLPSDYEKASNCDEYNGVFAKNDTVFSVSPYWNYDVTESEAISISRDEIAAIYEIQDEYYVTFDDNDLEFYCFEITYKHNNTTYSGYCTIYWREDVFVYMECLSGDADYLEGVYSDAMSSFSVI